ncbi:hypothetical protein LDENG_00106310 [Lucifuga dentata]|nr:hypothetical protein LDENG_00106310 [Lucifuga dentata]
MGKIDVFEIRVDKLTAELSKKNEEAQLFKNEAEKSFVEKNLLEKACEEAVNALKDLKEKFNMTEIKVEELEEQLVSENKKNEEYNIQVEQLRKDTMQHKVKYEELLSNFSELQSEKKAIQKQFQSGSSEVKTIEANLKMSEENEVKLTREIQRLEDEQQHLREYVNSLENKIQDRNQENEALQKNIEENFKLLQIKTENEKQIKAMEAKLCTLGTKFEAKVKAQEECRKENKILKKQIQKETAKSNQLENMINSLQEESYNLKRLNEEEHHKLLEDLESKSAFATELENEVQKLKFAAAEAIKSKEETELKCQQKIADMVALMEKHKNQYDRMVEEKDAELEENKKKEMEAVSSKTSLELELSKHKTENISTKQQLKIEIAQKENLQKELNDLKKEMSYMKITQLSEAKNQQLPAFSSKQARYSETPNENSAKRHVFDFSVTRKTPSYSRDDGNNALTKATEIHNEDLKTPKSNTNRVGTTAKIKSYRIRTPPSTPLRKGIMKLEPKSDSSDQSDLLTFANATKPSFSAPCDIVKKIQSPAVLKSPGNALKLAAMKRMRDAGWTVVTGSFKKKKKKTNEKIFA